MSHWPSMLYLLVPSVITAFYTPDGVSSSRLLAIGLIIDSIYPQTTFVLLFTAAAISTTISAA